MDKIDIIFLSLTSLALGYAMYILFWLKVD